MPSAAPGVHTGYSGSLQVWGAPTSQMSPSRASASAGKGLTDRQQFPEGTAGTVPTTTQALLQQSQPLCITRAEEGTPETPFMHPLPVSSVPQGTGPHPALSSALWARALTACFAHHNIRLPSWHSPTPLVCTPDTAQLLGATGTAPSRAEPCRAGDTKASRGHQSLVGTPNPRGDTKPSRGHQTLVGTPNPYGDTSQTWQPYSDHSRFQP